MLSFVNRASCRLFCLFVFGLLQGIAHYLFLGREVAHSRSPAVTAWPRGGVALTLCPCGARLYEHFQQLVDIDRAWPSRRPSAVDGGSESEAMAHAWVSATSRLQPGCGPPRPRASPLPALHAAHAHGGSFSWAPTCRCPPHRPPAYPWQGTAPNPHLYPPPGNATSCTREPVAVWFISNGGAGVIHASCDLGFGEKGG